MTFLRWVTLSTCLAICLPIVMSLSAGLDPFAGYRGIAGMLVAAAELGMEIRR